MATRQVTSLQALNKLSPTAQEIFRVALEDAERGVLQAASNQVRVNMKSTHWGIAKAAEIKRLRIDMGIAFQPLTGQGINAVTAKLVEDAYREGRNSIDEIISGTNQQLKSGGFHKIDLRKMAAIANALSGSVDKLRFPAFRSGLTLYKKAITEAAVSVVSGGLTRRQATQVAIDKLSSKGITGFVDSAGRKWSLQGYGEMATRATTAQAQVEGALTRMIEYDRDLAIFSAHSPTCPWCAPWQGVVVSISGKTEGYPTFDEAVGAGILHPNCAHGVTVYIIGLTEKPNVSNDPTKYNEIQKQRRLEHELRQSKQGKENLTGKARQKANKQIKIKKQRLDKHIEDKNLVPSPERERLVKIKVDDKLMKEWATQFPNVEKIRNTKHKGVKLEKKIPKKKRPKEKDIDDAVKTIRKGKAFKGKKIPKRN